MQEQRTESEWTIRVAAGEGFMANAIMALEWAAEDRRDGPARQALLRLAEACGRADFNGSEDDA